MKSTLRPLLNLCIFMTLPLCAVKAQEPVPNKPPYGYEIGLRPDWLKLTERYKVQAHDLQPDEIVIVKDLTYDKYTLEDEYDYNKTTRKFQWDTIRTRLVAFESIVAQKDAVWGIIQNYKTQNGLAALVGEYSRDDYDRIVDKHGVERYQAAPVYEVSDTITPVRYARDGALARIEERRDGSKFVRVAIAGMDGEWMVPNRYLMQMDSGIVFKIAIFVDRTNQNIVTLERNDKAEWMVRSMNPATTGARNPPYAQRTPKGLFVLQDRKAKMFYLVDGTDQIAGYAPWANRFSRGAYIHGVPVNNPNGAIVEYSWTLGTTPRSHMCVRNASSHAKFIYDWAPLHQTLIFVIE